MKQIHSADPPRKAIAVIPARGGSKGIPRKNIRPLFGKPLIAWTIEVALATPSFDRVIVSTDDQEIADISRLHGAEVPFLRPAALGQDLAGLGDVIDHALDRLEKKKYTPYFVATLYPTHPFRTSAMLEILTRKGLEGYSPVFTAREIQAGPYTYALLGRDATIRPLRDKQTCGNGSKTWLRPYGVFTGMRPGTQNNPYCHVLRHPAEMVDIDSPSDLALADAILTRRLYKIQ